MADESCSENLVEKNRGRLFDMYKEGKVDTSILNSTQLKNKNIEFKANTGANDLIIDSTDNLNEKFVESSSSGLGPIKSSHLIVNKRQKGNLVLENVKNVCWEFGEIEPDFVMGRNTCALFLSIQYHNAKPNYIYERMRNLRNAFDLRVLLILIDVNESTRDIRELTKLCIANNFTMLLSWSVEEAARYLESYKSFENKPPDLLMGERAPDGRSAREDELSALISFLTSAAAVNKTDARSLIQEFGTIEAIMSADREALQNVAGFGALKAKNLHDLFRRSVVRRASERDVDEEGE